jgi:hypothetical protein
VLTLPEELNAGAAFRYHSDLGGKKTFFSLLLDFRRKRERRVFLAITLFRFFRNHPVPGN